jgi:hypothetical protein
MQITNNVHIDQIHKKKSAEAGEATAETKQWGVSSLLCYGGQFFNTRKNFT